MWNNFVGTDVEAQLKIQRLISDAQRMLDEAMDIAQDRRLNFEFLGATYNGDDEMWTVTRYNETVEWSSSRGCIEDGGSPALWSHSGCTGG